MRKHAKGDLIGNSWEMWRGLRSRFPVLTSWAVLARSLYRTSWFGRPPILREAAVVGRVIAAHPVNSGKRALIFVPSQGEAHLATHASFAQGLSVRGFETTIVRCNRALSPCCNLGLFPALRPEQCIACNRFARTFFKQVGVPTLGFDEFFSPTDRVAAQTFVANAADADLPKLKYHEHPIGYWVQPSVAHFVRTDAISSNAAFIAVYREWLVKCIETITATERLLAKLDPAFVVTLNGHVMANRVMLELARAQGRRTLLWEVGMIQNSLAFSIDKAVDYDEPELWRRYIDRPLSREEEAKLDGYLQHRSNGGGTAMIYFYEMEARRDAVRRTLKLKEGVPVVALFPNITWDTAVLQTGIGFENLWDWLEHVVRTVGGRHDMQLVIRIHPAETILEGGARDSLEARLERTFDPLPENIRIVSSTQPISSYVLMDLCDFALVYASTTGLEVALRGKRAIVGAKVHYRDKGFTYDVSRREEFLPLFEKALSESGRLSAEELARARRYAYFSFFKTSVSFRSFTLHPDRRGPRLNARSTADYEMGRDPSLDLLINSLERGEYAL